MSYLENLIELLKAADMTDEQAIIIAKELDDIDVQLIHIKNEIGKLDSKIDEKFDELKELIKNSKMRTIIIQSLCSQRYNSLKFVPSLEIPQYDTV